MTAATGCWNVLVVTGSAPEEVTKFIVLSAEAICRVILLEAAHTSDASFDPAMVLFKSIIQVDARPVADYISFVTSPGGLHMAPVNATQGRQDIANLPYIHD